MKYQGPMYCRIVSIALLLFVSMLISGCPNDDDPVSQGDNDQDVESDSVVDGDQESDTDSDLPAIDGDLDSASELEQEISEIETDTEGGCVSDGDLDSVENVEVEPDSEQNELEVDVQEVELENDSAETENEVELDASEGEEEIETHAPIACQTEADCPVNEACGNDNFCHWYVPECGGVACPRPMECDAGSTQCVDPCDACETDCCENGVCYDCQCNNHGSGTLPMGCQTDADCCPDWTCYQVDWGMYSCTKFGMDIATTCHFDHDCPTGKHCAIDLDNPLSSEGICRHWCGFDWDFLLPCERCNERTHRIVRNDGEYCFTDEDCQSGYRCESYPGFWSCGVCNPIPDGDMENELIPNE